MSLVFGKYEKIRRIAQGGMGEVFLARQTGVLDRLAILKSLRQDLASEREFVEQFLDEARVAATLNHPNIVSIYDVGEWNGTYYIAMEYVPGEDLSKLWYAAAKAGVGLPFQVSVRICYEASLGLDHAHKARDVRGSPLNIVHRDVSPQNIMVRGDGVVKLVDFGIAKAANKSSKTQTGMVKGKLQYMSPEQVRGEALDGRSDQFSMGVVLWEMCTGRRLFKADTEINTLQKILQSPIPKPAEHVPGFPPELESTILKMLQRDVEKRFKSLGDVANDLKNYLDRAALSSGETTVAGFVQQILGKELEERIRDLTPMEPTEHAAPMPTRPSPSSMKQQPARSGSAAQQSQQKPAPNDGPTQVVEAGEDIRALQTGAAEWAVRKVDGKVMHFTEMSTLHQWILDGAVVGEDAFSTDGKTWKKLASAAQFQKFLEIAAAARQVSSQRPAAGAGFQRDRATTKPIAAVDPDNPKTLSLNVADVAAAGARGQNLDEATNDPFGAASRDPATEYSLGELPASKTGTWGAPEIAMVVAAAREREAALAAGKAPPAGPDGNGGPGGAGLTPTTRATEPLIETTRPVQRAARLPMGVWMLGGIVVALALVVGGLAAFQPDVLLALIGSAEIDTEVLKAITASKADDPQAIDALLKPADEAAKLPNAPADVLAAGAILHVARARIDDETDRIVLMSSDLDRIVPPEPKDGGKDGKDGKDGKKKGGKEGVDEKPPATDAKGHLDQAYKLATAALAPEKGVTAAGQLAMAEYHAEKGALPELETDAGAANATAKGKPVEAAVTAELTAIKALVEARKELGSTDPVAIRAAAEKLAAWSASAAEDPRARTLVVLLHARAAIVAEDDSQKADAAKVRDDAKALAENGAGDPRVPLLTALAKKLSKKVEKAPAPNNGGTNAVADAGPAVPNNGTNTTNNGGNNTSTAKADAGVAVAVAVPKADAGVAVVTPPPPPPTPETFESAMEKAKRAQRNSSPKEAAKWAKKALDFKPGSVEANLILGLAYTDSGLPGSARAAYQAVLAKDANNCDANFGIAKADDDEQKTEDARKKYLHFIDICPKDRDAGFAQDRASKLE